jgi:hypothetical protein
MPKKSFFEPVIHDWVCELPFQMQALLMTGIRGADQTNKHNSGKCIVRYMRGTVLKPAGDWNGKNNNDFMWGEYDKFHSYAGAFFDDHDEYPHHFIMHLVHCAEVIGYKHHDAIISEAWKIFYYNACHSFHMNPETEIQLDKRLNDFGCGIHNHQTPTP